MSETLSYNPEELPRVECEPARESAEFARAYTGFLDWAIAGGARPDFSQESETNRDILSRYQAAIEAIAKSYANANLRDSFQALLESRKLDPKTFRNQVDFTGTAVGVAIVEMHPGLLRRISPDARAMSYVTKKDAPFILIAKHGKPEADARERGEHLPHQMQHVLWKWGRKAATEPSTESNAFRQEGFVMYQEELIARMVSGGALSGYTHLRGLSAEDVAHDPIAKDLVVNVAELNELWKNTKTNDLLFAIWRARNFGELKRIAEESRQAIAVM